jgi:integrase
VSNIKLKYINAYIDRLGRPRHYLRRAGFKPIPLPGLPGSFEFMAAYESGLAATSGTDARPQIGASRTRAGSISAMIAGYVKDSAEFDKLEPTSKIQYMRIFEHMRRDYGDMSMRTLQRPHVVGMLDDRKGTPSAARDFLRCLRVLIAYAIRTGARQDDPTIKLQVAIPDTGGHHSWAEQEIAIFRARYAIDTRERLALEILLGTAVRCSDAVRLGRQHVHNGVLALARTQKTKAALTIDVPAELAAAIDAAAPADSLLFLLNEYGRPFPAAGFSRWFAKAAKRAGLTDCTAHGLRKAAARRLAEAQCTAPEIAAVTTHRSLAQVQPYIDDADRVRLARNATAKLKAVK